MASLRDTFSFADPGVSQQGLEELQVQNMGTLRKGYEGGDIGTDANAAAAQLSTLRANGQHAEADALQTELAALQQRQGLYAPEVGGVENIHGVGDAATWALEGIGQGAASMQDPILATTAMNAGGRLLEMVPHKGVQMAGKALSWGAPAVAYGMNQNQLKGEFVQSAMRDPELMARTSWQDLNQTANIQGAGGAVLDTVLPAVLGRQFAGKAGMAALSKLAPTSFGGRTLAAMGFEGATEVGQNMGSQYALGHLNPNRDTSGDFMENVNAGLGGMVGAGPLAAVGAAAEGGHQRLGGVANALGKKAGDTVDLATGAVDSAKEKGRSWWDRLTGGKEAEDLQGGEGAQALDPREIDVLLDKHLDPQTATDEDFLAADVERTGIVVKHLRALAETNDRAAELLGRVMDPGAGDQVRALDESANFLKEHYNVEELDAEGNNLGRSLPSKGAELAGRAAKGIVKGAAKVAGDMISGAARGLASKKNLQADEGGSASYTLADWEATQSYRRAAKYVALSSTKAGANNRERISRMNLAARQAAEFARTKYQGKEGLARMASHTAFELVDAADGLRRNDLGGAMTGGRNARLGRVAGTMRRLYGAEDAMKMADTIASIVGAENPNSKYLNHAAEYVKAEIQRLETPEGRIQAKQDRAELVSKIAATVSPQVHQKLLDNGVNLYGEHGEQFLKLIEKLADGTSQPEMRHKLNGMVGSGTVAKMLDVVNESDIAKGKDEKPQKVSPMFGETADEQEILGEGFQVDDDGEVTDYEKRQGEKQVGKTSAPKLYGFKNTQATRSSADWRNPFAGAAVSKAALAEWRDSVESDKVHGRAPKEDPRIEAATKRPSLFGQDDTLSDGRNAIEARIEAMKAGLGEKSASWSVGAKKAADLLKDMNMSDVARISLYRDYLRKAMKSTKATVEQKAKWKEEVGMLGLVLSDLTSGKLKDSKANAADRGEEFADAGVDDTSTSGIHSLRKKRMDAQKQAMRDADDAGAREFSQQALARTMPGPTDALTSRRERAQALKRADNYFANRYLVVAEDMTNRAPEDISLAEVKSMTNTGLKAMDFARKITSETDSRIEKTGLTGAEANQLRKAAKREHDEVVDAYNILEFAPLEGDKPVYIKAGDLVYWARTQRNKSEVMTKEKASKFGRGDLDREYLNDLMTGVSTILASGAVGPQMPVKRNKFGKPEAFETPQQGKNGRKPSVADSVPDSLRLVTMTAGQLNYKSDDRKGVFLGPGRPDADARADEDYQAAVVKDQRRSEEPAVVDPLQAVGEMRTMDPQDYAALTPDERKTLNGFADRYAKAEDSAKTEIAREQREFLDGLSLRKDGKRYSTAVDTTSFERERGMTDDAERVNAENGTKLGVSGPKGGKTPAGESYRAVYKDAPKQADQIRRDRRMRNADGTKREVIEDGAEFPVEMTDDEISPLDFFPDQEPGAVPDEFADAQFRNRIEGYDPATTVSAEHKMSAAGQAKERGDALRGKLVPGRGEGRTELTAKQLEGINSIAARIRSAYRPERREKGDAGLVGGWHYLYPAAHALNTDFLSTLASGGKDPAGLVDTLEFLRGQLNRALLESGATPKQKVAIAKLMAPKASAGRINEGNVQGILEKNAPARDESLAPTEQAGKTQAAPEVAAQEAPKAQAKPSGAAALTVNDHKSSGYRERTKFNADSADVTVAIAKDFTTAGERLTRTVAGNRYTHFGFGDARKDGRALAQLMQQRGATSLNVAGNGIYTLAKHGMTQAEVNQHVYELLSEAHAINPITKIVSGGQTGVDIAGAVAAKALGIDAVITLPQGFLQRNEAREDRRLSRAEIVRQIEEGAAALKPRKLNVQSAGASIASRARHQGVKIVGTGDPTLAAASDTAAGRVLDEGVQAWRKGVTYKQFLASPEYLGAMHGLMVHKLMGTPGVQTAIDELNARAHQMFAIKYDKELEAAVMSRLSATDENTPAKLRDMMREILVADVDPATKVIARAVNTIAGDVDVIGTQKADIRGNSGVYNSLTKVIRVAEDADLGHAGTVLHEGVHAATVTAVIRDKGLHRAVYRLMDHVIEQNPRLRDAYGLTTSLEFLAEGLGNISFQRELAKIKPNDAVARYLGKTVANAWDAFVGMVRTALNLDPKHESALAQLLDLGGRAMLATRANPSGLTHAEFETFVERGVAPEKRARELADAMVNSRQIEAADRPILRQTLKDLVDGVVQDGLVPHKIVVAMATTLETFNLLLAGQTIELGSIFTALDANINSDASAVPSKAGRKLNAQSNEIHDDLGRSGFAATHDSPIRHEGKFDWRSHKGKGEGNAAFGAGTYLSTANGVHKSYKNQFTAMVNDGERVSSPEITAAMDRLQAIGYRIDMLRREAEHADLAAEAEAEAVLGDYANTRIIAGLHEYLGPDDVYFGLREGIPWLRGGRKTGNRATDQAMEKLRKALDKVFDIGQDSEGAWVSGEEGAVAKVGIPAELIDQIKASADDVMEAYDLTKGEFGDHVKSLEDLNTSVKQIAKYRKQLAESRAHAKEEQRIIANEMAQLAVDEDEAQQDLDWEIEKARKRGGHKYRSDVSPTYQVSVDIKPEQLLDWDKPLLEQSELVQEALKELKEPSTSPLVWQERGEKHFALGASIRPNSQRYMALYGADLIGWYLTLEEAKKATEAYIARRRLRTYQDLRTGGDIYNFFVRKFGSQAAASDYLQSLGILGHRYAASGGKNDTHPNFVIFDDSKITTNYVHFNQQDARTPRDTPASPEEIAKAKAWMNKVLPKVRVEFEKLTGYSGEFIEAENLVKISTTAAAGVMQTAYHEGLHAFFAGLAKNPEALRVMSSIADNRVVFRRLQALLAKYPAAKAQLVDGEERLAYAFQFWAAGKLQLPVGPARGFFAKLRKFFRQVAGLIKDEEKAADIFQAFNDGKLGDPSTAGKVLNDILAQGTWTKKNLKRLDGLMQRVRQLIMPAEEILLRAPSAEAKALARQLFTNPGDEGSAGMQEGLLNAQRTVTTKEMNRFANAIAGLDDKDMANVAKLLEDKTPLHEIPYAPYLKAVKEIRQQLKDFHTYMQSSTMEMGTVKDDYFPRVWSLTKLIDGREDFVKMLMDNYPERLAEVAGAANLRNTKHGKLLDGAVEMDNKAAAEEITNYLIKRNGTDGKVATQREDGVLAPYFAAGEKREFAWIETQKSEPWQNKNLIGIMTGYLHEGVRSAEYTRRFGRKGEHLDASLRTIEAELTNHARAELAKGEFKDQKAANAWVTRQMRGIRQATGAMEGSLGKDISDRMRKFNSWMMVYQNVRLLPLTLFASVVDPLGMIARGATMREAFEAFQRGIQEVFRGWADLFRQEPKGALSDKWTKLAEHIGAVDAAILSHHASEEYSSTYLSHGAKQINDAFFKINGMEAWNRGMRVGAVKSAAAFIARHKALPEVHSQRWLTELGLTPDQITLDGEGNLITDVQDLVDQTGVSKAEAERQIDAIHAALNRWTLSAVLTPNAAQRPAWSSDPHYSLFFHLKQFSYSFHQTILKRAVKEMNYGNMGPIAAFAGYIPVMIASDVMKGLIVGGGTLPNHMQGMDLGDWVMHGLERSGTLGIGAIGVDASQDMFSVFGPGVEQLVDGITEPIADTTLRAMPLNPLVRAMME